jgi:hypothetical protein
MMHVLVGYTTAAVMVCGQPMNSNAMFRLKYLCMLHKVQYGLVKHGPACSESDDQVVLPR